MVRDELERAGREDLIDIGVLLVSELVTNALVHVGAGIELTVRVDEAGLRVEVADANPHPPIPRHYAVAAGTGRGLAMLSRLADRWGSSPAPSGEGKVVWFDLSTDGRDEAEPETQPELIPAASPLAGSLEVELLNLPLLLHAAWQRHAETLLREHLLIGIGEDDEAEHLWTHALASQAMSLLLEHLPTPDLGEDAEELMATAVEPGVSSAREVIVVPAELVSHFRVLDQVMDAALALADAGVLLTPPTQPEIRDFRRWVCAQVERQSGGGMPQPWDSHSDAAPPRARTPLDWSLATVAQSLEAVIAADDTNRLLAISASALQLLGYDDADELVGRRLVSIIPDRYHQAHVAGFTLHLINGRSPLLGREVTLPALRRDGTEIDVRLVVRAEKVPGGRSVFVADLAPA